MTSLKVRWDRLNIVQQFALMAFVVVGSGTMVIGNFVSSKIEANVVHHAAAATAIYVDRLYGNSQAQVLELQGESALSEDRLRALDASIKDFELGHQVVAFRILRPDGRIVYSTSRRLIGRTLPPTSDLLKALDGQVAAKFAGLADEDVDNGERAPEASLLAIYAPIRAAGTNRVVGAAEIFANEGPLKDELRTARLQSWMTVGGVATLQFILLYGIVRRDNKTIGLQRAGLLDARRASAEANERFLRRVGMELHDGAAQLIALALLRLDNVRPSPAAEHSKSDEFEKIRAVLNDSLQEIRHLAAGLAPPQLDHVSAGKAVELAIRQHEQRTGTSVASVIDELPSGVSPVLKACIYRFVQEGLNNACRHAAGAGQSAYVSTDGEELLIEIVDDGPGFSPAISAMGDGLGLSGLRDRIESLGGKFSVYSQVGSGTCLRASFQIASSGGRDG